MATLSWRCVGETEIGGEGARCDIGLRELTLSNGTKADAIANLPDLVSATTKTLWDSTASTLTSPAAVMIVVDPDDVYEDNASTPPTVTIEVSIADDTSGTNIAVAGCIDVRREVPLVLPGANWRSEITQASANKVLSKIRARNNGASGTGTVKVRAFIPS